jgi:hypothetical protein
VGARHRSRQQRILRDRARGIIRTLGYTDPPSDSDFGFDAENTYLDHLAGEQTSHPGWDTLSSGPPYAISFWYRQSPRPIAPFDLGGFPPIYDDPPLLTSGLIRLRLDPEGRLRRLEAAPTTVLRGEPVRRLEQLLLLSGRAYEDARLVHPFLPTADRGGAVLSLLCPNDAGTRRARPRAP